MKSRLPIYEGSTRNHIQSLVKHFSPSFFLSYKECPKAFYYQYIAKIYLPQKSVHLVFGEAFHLSIDDIIKNHPLPGIHERYEKYFMGKLVLEESDDYHKLLPVGHAMIDNWADKFNWLNTELNLAKGKSELWIEAILKDPFSSETLPLKMKGRIDYMTDEDMIVEFKTSSGLWNMEDIKFKWQTIFYSWMYYQQKGRHPKQIVYLIFTKNKNPQIQILTANYTLDDYSKLFQECKNIIDKIELSVYDRAEGWHPSYCSCHKYEEALTT